MTWYPPPRVVLGSLLAVMLGVLACQSSKKQERIEPIPIYEPGPPKPVLPDYCESTPAKPLRYPDVEAVFAEHCHRCHTIANGNNSKAQAVYESSQYPFTTNQPDTLLTGLASMIKTRRGIDDAARCLVLSWIYDGALDADGNAPPWAPATADE